MSIAFPTALRLYGTAPDSIVDGPGLRFAVFVQGCTHGCPGCHNPESQPHEGGNVRAIDDLMAEIAANKLSQGITISGGEPFEQAAACAELARRAHELGLNVWTYSGYTYEQLTKAATSTSVITVPAQVAPSTSAHVSASGTAAPALASSAPTQNVSRETLSAARPDCAAQQTPAQKPSVPQNVSREKSRACSLPTSDGTRSLSTSNGVRNLLDPDGVRDLLAHTDVLVDGPFVQSQHSYDLKWCGSSNQRLIDVPATQRTGRIVLWETQDYLPGKPASW